MSGTVETVLVDGRRLRLTNLERVMYPATETTKAEVLGYFTTVADLLFEQVRDRLLTRKRWPHGVTDQSFFEKNVPAGTPDWIAHVTYGREPVRYPVLRTRADARAAFTWFAQLGVLEFHVPQWRLDGDGRPMGVDRMVIDLDPGTPAGLRECRETALRVRDVLEPVGLEPGPVLSGSKGMQLYCDLPPEGLLPAGSDAQLVSEFARTLAVSLSKERPELIEWRMTRSLRAGKVLLDWSQNSAAKTTIAPWSLRGLDRPFVATPITWGEVEDEQLHQRTYQEVVETL